jgi:hypothetical protein
MHNALYNRINSCYNILKQNQSFLALRFTVIKPIGSGIEILVV